MLISLSYEHLEQLSFLEKELFLDHCYSKEQLKQMLEDKNYINLGFYENNILYGYAILLKLPDELEIIKIGVSKQAQGKGIGTKMMEEIKKISPEIFLEVSSLNTNAIGFYQYHGFKLISTRKQYYSDGSDALIFKWVKENNNV